MGKLVEPVEGASSDNEGNLLEIQTGRVSRRRSGENEEIQMYLSKLKDLVPFMPKNKKLSKLEIIQYVIDYIVDLQLALAHKPLSGLQRVLAVKKHLLKKAAEEEKMAEPTGSGQRQPLGVLTPSPNTIVASNSQGPSSATEPTSPQRPMSPAPLEKVQPSDSRPVSC